MVTELIVAGAIALIAWAGHDAIMWIAHRRKYHRLTICRMDGTKTRYWVKS